MHTQTPPKQYPASLACTVKIQLVTYSFVLYGKLAMTKMSLMLQGPKSNLLLLRTPVSARSYRASAFLVD